MFKIGQSVICIDDTPRRPLPEDFQTPIKGHIYTVKEIYEHPNGVMVITVEEIINRFSESLGREIGFAMDRFRPIDTLSESEEWAEETLMRIAEEIEDEFLVRIPKKG